MLVISSREFRENQKSYLDKIDQGIEILIRRGKSRSYRITPVKQDDSLMSKEEFYSMLDEARGQVKRGEVFTMQKGENIENFLGRMLCTE